MTDAVGEGLLTGLLPCETHLVDGELFLGGAPGGVKCCGNLGSRFPTQGERDVLAHVLALGLALGLVHLGRRGLVRALERGPLVVICHAISDGPWVRMCGTRQVVGRLLGRLVLFIPLCTVAQLTTNSILTAWAGQTLSTLLNFLAHVFLTDK